VEEEEGKRKMESDLINKKGRENLMIADLYKGLYIFAFYFSHGNGQIHGYFFKVIELQFSLFGCPPPLFLNQT
jgi:hypothetical protein